MIFLPAGARAENQPLPAGEEFEEPAVVHAEDLRDVQHRLLQEGRDGSGRQGEMAEMVEDRLLNGAHPVPLVGFFQGLLGGDDFIEKLPVLENDLHESR